MFNDKYLCCLNANRQQEINLDHFLNISIQNPQAHQYAMEYFLQSILLLTTFLSFLKLILQICDELGLKKETKWLVKKSLDIYVLTFNRSCPEKIFEAACNIFVTAVKFNEDPIFYEELKINGCLEKFNLELNTSQTENQASMQSQLYNLCVFSLNLTTPYDYLGLFESSFLLDKKMINRVKLILDFSFTIYELMLLSAQELYFGCLLMAYREKNMNQQWILTQTISKQKAQQVAEIIRKHYEKEVEEAAKELVSI